MPSEAPGAAPLPSPAEPKLPAAGEPEPPKAAKPPAPEPRAPEPPAPEPALPLVETRPEMPVAAEAAGVAKADDAPAEPNRLANPLRDGTALEPLRPGPAAADNGPVPGQGKKRTDDSRVRAAAAEGHDKEPFDPIKENGPIFVGWPQPRLALVITGRQDGYLEPCGCAGLDRMKGGLARRYSFINDLRQRGWPVVAVDVGGLAKGFGRQTQMKFQLTVEAMKQMRYDAVALGMSDLQLPADELASDIAGSKEQPTMFVSANVGLFGFHAEITAQKRVVQAGGIRVGITSVLGASFQKQVHNPDVTMIDAEEALGKIVPELKKECNLLVLLAHATREESIALAGKFPDFDVVVTAGGPSEPPTTAATLPGGKTYLIEVGEKGMNAIVLGVFEEPQQPIRYQRVPLDSRFALAEEMKKLMKEYQLHLQLLGFSGLGIRAIPHPAKEQLGGFVGSAKCQSCHEESYDIWKKTGHAHSFDTLVKADPPRHYDPECISCHVIGWHGTQYFPYEGGYESKEKTPHLAEVGCESCHGPGEAHVKAEMGNDEALQERLRKAAVLTKADAEKHFCVTCHDGDNSPDYKFETYWPKVEHYEAE